MMPAGIVSNVEPGSILSVYLLYHEHLHLFAGSFARQHLLNYNKLIDLIEKIEKDGVIDICGGFYYYLFNDLYL